MTLSIANLPEEQRPTTVEFANYQMDDDAFYDFCRQNEHLKFERNSDGIIIAMPNTGGKTGIRNSVIIFKLYGWAESFGGLVFDSSTAFKLPNGATRSPDVAWLSDTRWNALTESQQEKFPPVAPEFVVELMSATDSLKNAKEKMQEYIANGVLLGWLINPTQEEVMIYRADGTISRHTNFDEPLTGEAILPGFAFNLRLLIR
ncbi:Uma2 family endonuclease [Spirosoma sp. HMF3257]|uniref:Uma2 family endonuclease n=1 Tax=Spirosoma telluris TaxID=2183553 RepID=A0A327NEU3_9BACT|nr:Uma2 family endonuclease [Spirosoma telluris]RAI73850.1 Uma2 family endonuclease [Spirosoma telluris]